MSTLRNVKIVDVGIDAEGTLWLICRSLADEQYIVSAAVTREHLFNLCTQCDDVMMNEHGVVNIGALVGKTADLYNSESETKQ